MLNSINRSITKKVALLSIFSMALLLIIVIGFISYENKQLNNEINTIVQRSFEQKANSELSNTASVVTDKLSLLVTPVIKNLDVVKSNLELSAKESVAPGIIVQQFEAAMKPQDEDVFSGYMVFEKSTWPKNIELTNTAKKAINKDNKLAPFYFPTGPGQFDYVAMSSFSNRELNANGEKTDDWHLSPYESGQLFLMEPYYYDVPNRGKELITTISNVINLGDQAVGSVGFDLSLVSIQKFVENIDAQLYGGLGRIVVGSWKGVVLADSDNASNVGKRVSELTGYLDWNQAKTLTNNAEPVLNDSSVLVFSSVDTNTTNPWIVGVSIPQSVINESGTDFSNWLTSQSEEARFEAILIGIAALLIGAIVMVVISRSISASLNRLIERLKDIVEGKGDLTQRITVIRNDESGQLGNLINRLMDKLHTTISSITEISHSVSSTSESSRHSVAEIVTRLESQNNEIGTLSVAVNEMAATALEVAGSAVNASKAAEEAKEHCSLGITEISSTTIEIEKVYNELSNAETKIKSLSKSTENIESILGVIGGIAEQTNLLALNAAIEAARAGEQGRGFAVVADEVRVLAGRTQNATQEIRQMIEQFTDDTQSVVSLVNNSHEAVLGSVEAAKHTEQTFVGINGLIDSINMQNHQIASAAEEQSRVNDEINRNVTAISDMSTEAGEIINKTDQFSEDVHSNSKELQRHLDQFSI